MNPLERIRRWYTALPEDIQNEIATLAGHLHPNIDIAYETGMENKVKMFKDYMDSLGLSGREVTKRTLWLTRLLSFSFSGRATEQDWANTMDLHLDMLSSFRDEGNDEMVEFSQSLLQNIPKLKETWVKICDDWHSLNATYLTDKQVTEWYLDQIRSHRG
ncbi:MAG: hypothetical protein ACJ77K_03270 [Bacteroidia bacterium]